jgi:6-phosphogluconolactonase
VIKRFRQAFVASSVMFLIDCGGGDGGTAPVSPPPALFTVGGTVAGLAMGESVALTNNGTDVVSVRGDKTFVFGSTVMRNGTYSVIVTSQPNGQSCTVSAGSGVVVNANVTTVAVICTNRPQYAYVINDLDNTLSQYSIDPSGTLSTLGIETVATGNSPETIVVDPSHRYVYVTDVGEDAVSQYLIQSDGSLSPNSPPSVKTGTRPFTMALSPDGRWAYVANSGDNTISQFSVSPTGSLESVSTLPVSTGIAPLHISASPDGKYVYVSNYGSVAMGAMSISQYSVTADTGELVPLNPNTIQSVSPHPGDITVDMTSTYAYVGNSEGDSVSVYSIGADGTLSSQLAASVPAGTEPLSLAIDPSNRYAYVMNFGLDIDPSAVGSISQFTFGATGSLTPLAVPSVSAGVGPALMAFDQSGNFAYVINMGSYQPTTSGPSHGTVYEYAIGGDGSLTLIGTIASGHGSGGIATTY